MNYYLFVILTIEFVNILCNRSYKGYWLLKCGPETNITTAIRESKEVKYFQTPVSDANIVALISNNSYHSLIKGKITCNVLNENFQSILDEENPRLPTMSRIRKSRNSIFQYYPRHIQINKFLLTLVKKNSKIACLRSIGFSYQKRVMKIIKISGSKNKSIIWIDAGIHAREWIAPITSLYVANKLVSDYKKDASVKKIVDSFEWHILPSANPDGYEYSRKYDRFWRKTRSLNRGQPVNCIGVDPNRNWDIHWNEIGTSNDPCDETYGGPYPFSEIETRNMRNYLLKHKKRMKAYLTFHSAGQLWMNPWGYTKEKPANYGDMIEKAKVAVKALAQKFGTEYKVGLTSDLLPPASGGSDDWALAFTGVSYSYTVELRPSNISSLAAFVLPANQIRPVGEEIFDAVKAFAEAIM